MTDSSRFFVSVGNNMHTSVPFSDLRQAVQAALRMQWVYSDKVRVYESTNAGLVQRWEK